MLPPDGLLACGAIPSGEGGTTALVSAAQHSISWYSSKHQCRRRTFNRDYGCTFEWEKKLEVKSFQPNNFFPYSGFFVVVDGN